MISGTNKWLSSLSVSDRQLYYDRRNAKNRERYAKDKTHREKMSKKAVGSSRELRLKALYHLGGRCSSATCSSTGSDGLYGCNDPRCLQIDHIAGDGAKKRKLEGEPIGDMLYRKVLKEVSGVNYQLLCANCNWIKRSVNNEVPKSRFFNQDCYGTPVDVRKAREKDADGKFLPTNWREV